MEDFTSGYIPPELEKNSNGQLFTLHLLMINCWLAGLV